MRLKLFNLHLTVAQVLCLYGLLAACCEHSLLNPSFKLTCCLVLNGLKLCLLSPMLFVSNSSVACMPQPWLLHT